MMEAFNLISGACSIISFLIAIFTACTVIRISKTLNCSSWNNHTTSEISIKGSEVSGSVSGRDIINEDRP